MKYVGGDVGELSDWEFVAVDFNELIGKCMSDALQHTFKNGGFPIDASLVGGDLVVGMYFSTTESNANRVTFREPIKDVVQWSMDGEQTRLEMEATLKSLRAAVDYYERELEIDT